MGALIALAFLAATIFAIVAVLATIGFILKTILWIVFFPIRFVFKTVFWVLGAGLAALLVPVFLVVAAVVIIGGIIAALLAMLAPLIPIALVALVGWAIYRASVRRPSPVI